MEIKDYIQILLFLILLIGLTPILGTYIGKVLSNESNLLTPIFKRPEQFIYKLIGANLKESMTWRQFLIALLCLNLFGFVFLFMILITQQWLPFNPQHISNMKWDQALNTAVSFITNTNWQSYNGETALSYFSQMIGLTVQNFLSAATGIAVLTALVTGIISKTTNKIGNFWVIITRSVLYILLPLSIIFAIFLAGQGVIQNLDNYSHVTTLENEIQVIPQGPVASQVAIKQLGTNGGGFFGSNSAHPFENPTPISNFIQVLAILLIPASLTYAYGRMVKSQKQGWSLFSAMFILLVVGVFVSLYASNVHSMEGIETRFGTHSSALWSAVTTAASNGSVNAMHDSLSPLVGMISMINMMLGEVIFGGIGTGLYGIIIFVFLTVFIAGLMVGRTPEYLGKKIEAFEIKMAMLVVLCPSIIILLFTAIACLIPAGLSSISNGGPHGFSQILYTFTSTAANNGSSFSGLNSSTTFYNLMTAFAMLIGRFGVIIPVLAIAGNLALKKVIPVSSGTFKTDNPIFVGLLIIIILIVGGLTFFPALSLGPIVDHILLQNGVSF